MEANKVKKVTIGKTVTALESLLFEDMTSLEEVLLTNVNTINIPDSCFKGCTNLKTVNANLINEIGKEAFFNCGNLTSFNRFNDVDNSHSFNKIGEYAFANSGLKKANISLNSSIDSTWIGDYCFENCKLLEEVKILKSAYQGSYMFKGCDKLKKVQFPEGQACNYVGKYVFDGCKSIESLEFTDSLYSFMKGYFNDCTSLKEVKFKDYEDAGFSYVQKYAFNNCKSLTAVSFPESLNSINLIEDAAFYGCSSLKQINFYGIPYVANTIDPILRKTGLFRARTDCNIHFKNADIEFKYDASKEQTYVDKNEYPSDKDTKTNFKIACDLAAEGKDSVWYYNAKEIKQYADEHHIPVLIMYSYESCTPCQAYMKNVHQDKNFQDWAKKQKFLLCRIEADKPKGLDEELRYCMEDLKNGAFNFDLAKTGTVRSYNAFGNVPPSSKKLLYGWFSPANYMPPAMTFYYKNEKGEVLSYYDYSFHDLIKIFEHPNLGVDKFILCLKSLCLYHFDGNKLSSAKFVVDAEKEFVATDYQIDADNPYLVEEGLICIDRWDRLSSNKTADAVIAAMKDILQNEIEAPSRLYPEYIGGCLFGDIDWIDKTFDTSIQLMDDPKEINAELSKVKILIGSKTYRLEMSESMFKKDIDTPCGISTIFKYSLVEFELKQKILSKRKIQYRYKAGDPVYAEGYDIFSLIIEIEPGSFREVYPKLWITTPNGIKAISYEEYEMITPEIDRSYDLYAEWPAISVNLIYNSFENEHRALLVEIDTEVEVASDGTYGFVCWNDYKDERSYKPSETITLTGSKNVFASCYYDVTLTYDLNGGILDPGKSANPQTAKCSRYVSSDFEDYSIPAAITLTAHVPKKSDGSYFKWWQIDDLHFLANQEVNLTSNAKAVAQYVFDPVYQFSESINIDEAATITMDGPHEETDCFKKTYGLNVNDGYIFEKWEVTVNNGSSTEISTVYTKDIVVALKKVSASSALKTLYAQSKAFFTYDASWTRVYDVNDKMTSYHINGIAKDDDMHVKGRTDIKKVEFANTVTGLQKDLFKGCTALEEVHLTNNITQFGESIFEGCINLKKMYFS